MDIHKHNHFKNKVRKPKKISIKTLVEELKCESKPQPCTLKNDSVAEDYKKGNSAYMEAKCSTKKTNLCSITPPLPMEDRVISILTAFNDKEDGRQIIKLLAQSNARVLKSRKDGIPNKEESLPKENRQEYSAKKESELPKR